MPRNANGRAAVADALRVLTDQMHGQDAAVQRQAASVILRAFGAGGLVPDGGTSPDKVRLAWSEQRHVSPLAWMGMDV